MLLLLLVGCWFLFALLSVLSLTLFLLNSTGKEGNYLYQRWSSHFRLIETKQLPQATCALRTSALHIPALPVTVC